MSLRGVGLGRGTRAEGAAKAPFRREAPPLASFLPPSVIPAIPLFPRYMLLAHQSQRRYGTYRRTVYARYILTMDAMAATTVRPRWPESSRPFARRASSVAERGEGDIVLIVSTLRRCCSVSDRHSVPALLANHHLVLTLHLGFLPWTSRRSARSAGVRSVGAGGVPDHPV